LYFRILGAEIGKNVQLGKGLRITWPHNVIIADNVTFERNVTIKIDGPWMQGRLVEIGENTFVGEGVEFNIKKLLKIGNNALIGSGVKVIDHDHGISNKTLLIRVQKESVLSVFIEDDAWLGVNVCVLKGVRIGKGAVVAAGAVVTSSVPDYEIWGGIPAKQIGVR
jgi:acetyltransferase-like isoleucine patch superfamily enzyme